MKQRVIEHIFIVRGAREFQFRWDYRGFQVDAPLGAQVIVSTHVPGARKLPAASAAIEFRQVIYCLHYEAANLARRVSDD
jgi:hypothetical protein